MGERRRRSPTSRTAAKRRRIRGEIDFVLRCLAEAEWSEFQVPFPTLYVELVAQVPPAAYVEVLPAGDCLTRSNYALPDLAGGPTFLRTIR
jgi:hypothetical protein